MQPGIRAFGTAGPTRLTFTLASGPGTGDMTLSLPRAFWFDQDINGSWLVWASGPDDDGDDAIEFGSIVVRDPTVAAFLDELGQLVASPQRFAHEPRFEESHRPQATIRDCPQQS